MAYEMKIFNPSDSGFVTKIEWNYEDLKTQITAAAEGYATAVYTDEYIKAAKADRAKLNKFVTALKGQRTEIRKKLLAPDEQFGQEVMEIVSIVQKAIDNIDSQIKAYEQRKRDEKCEWVKDTWDEISAPFCLDGVVSFEQVLKPEWLNTSASQKSISEDIYNICQKIRSGLDIIDQTDSEYAADMKRVFLTTLDIGAAMQKRNQLEDEAKRRAAYEEERRKAQEEKDRAAAEEAKQQAAAGHEPVQQGVAANVDQPQEEKRWLAFEALLTVHQAQILASFMRSQGIEFRPVQ